MKVKLSIRDKLLWQRIDEILYWVWDPIGVTWVPPARDEYYSYIPQVFKLAKMRGSARSIEDYLGGVESDMMGLKINAKKNKKVTDLILSWVEYYSDNESRLFTIADALDEK